MRRPGNHFFFWTGGQTLEGLAMTHEKSAEHGYHCIEFACFRPEHFDLDRLARASRELDMRIGLTMGLPVEMDVSSKNADAVAVAESAGRRTTNACA